MGKVAKHSHLFISRGASWAVSYCLMQMRSLHLQRINNDINIFEEEERRDVEARSSGVKLSPRELFTCPRSRLVQGV